MAVALSASSGNQEDVNGAGGDIALPAPTSIASGDFRGHFCWDFGGSAAPDIGTGLTDAGSAFSGSYGVRGAYKVAGGSEGSITHTCAGSETVSLGYAFRATGAHASTPLNTSTAGHIASGTTGLALPTVTTTVDNCLIVYCVIIADVAATPVVSTATAHDTFWNAGGADLGSISYELQATAGTTTARSITWSGGGSSTADYVIFAIEPSGGASVTPTVVTATASVPAPAVKVPNPPDPQRTIMHGRFLRDRRRGAGSAGNRLSKRIVRYASTNTATDGTIHANNAADLVLGQLWPNQQADATVTPTVVTATASVPAPTVSTSVNANVSATVVTGVASVPAPTAGAGVGVTATVVTATASVPAPTVSTADDASVTATVVTATANAPSPTAATSASAPRIVRPSDAFGYDNEVALDWDAPTSNGGSSITGYRIRISSDDGDNWSTHTADTGTTTTAATLTSGLTVNVRYLFEIAAINGAGVGAVTISEWGCTPVAAAAAITPPSATVQTSAPWQLARIDQTALPLGTTYNYRYTGDGVRVYVVDTGVRVTHDEFTNTASGYSVGATGATNDVLGHGTQVASMVAGITRGAAKNATIVPVKVFEDDHDLGTPYPTEANLLDVLAWIAANHPGGPAVVNMSFALGPTGSGQLAAATAAVAAMIADGFVFVQALGNEAGAATSYIPTPQPGLIIVAGTSDDDALWSGSSLGDEADLFAPSAVITVADSDSDSDTLVDSGTSFGCPLVAGTLALWLEANPDLTPRQLHDLVRASSTKDVVTGTLLGTPNRLLYTLADIPPVPSASVTATVVTATASVPAPTASAGSSLTATVVTATVSVPAPSVTAGGSANVTATVVTALASVPAPTVSVGVTVTATVVTALASVPSSTASAGASLTATVVTATADVPAPSVSAGGSASVTATVVTATASVPAPSLSAGSTVTATVVTALASVLSATVVAGAVAAIYGPALTAAPPPILTWTPPPILKGRSA